MSAYVIGFPLGEMSSDQLVKMIDMLLDEFVSRTIHCVDLELSAEIHSIGVSLIRCADAMDRLANKGKSHENSYKF